MLSGDSLRAGRSVVVEINACNQWKTMGELAMVRKRTRFIRCIAVSGLLLFLAVILYGVFSDSEPKSIREFIADSKSRVAAGEPAPSLTYFQDVAREALVRILHKDIAGQTQEAIDALFDEDARKICGEPLEQALWEVGRGESCEWRADSPVFKALFTALERERKDSAIRRSLVRALVGHEHSLEKWRCSDRQVAEMLRAVANPSFESDGWLIAYIGMNAYNNKWTDLVNWFEKIASDESKSTAYGPMVRKAFDSRDQQKVSECLAHMRRNADYSNMFVAAHDVYLLLPESPSLSDIEFYKSVLRPFLIELTELPPTSYWRKVDGTPSLLEEQRKREIGIELARGGAYFGLVNVNDSEAVDILERAVLNGNLPANPSRKNAFRALGGLSRQADRAIETALRILANNPELPADVRIEGYGSVSRLWCHLSEEVMFFQRDPEFEQRAAQFRELVRRDITRAPEEFCLQMVRLAQESIVRFDKPLTMEILDAALTVAQNDETRKYLERAKKELAAQDDDK